MRLVLQRAPICEEGILVHETCKCEMVGECELDGFDINNSEACKCTKKPTCPGSLKLEAYDGKCLCEEPGRLIEPPC